MQKSFIMLHRQKTLNSVQAFSTKHITEGPWVMRILGPGKVALRKMFVSGFKSQLVGSKFDRQIPLTPSPLFTRSPLEMNLLLHCKSGTHCKYIRCNFYSFWMCPTFHCNHTLRFTSNFCSKYSGIIVKLIYSFLL